MNSDGRTFNAALAQSVALAAQAESADDSERPAEKLQRLQKALGEIDDGIILLDSDLRLEFINRAACEFSGSPNIPDPLQKPSYAELIRGASVATGNESLEAFIAQRLATVSAGDPAPVEVRFANGKIARARCIALPDGGRLLSYTDITEISRRNSELEQLRSALDQVEYGVVLLNGDLCAQFINRAFRKMAKMPDALADTGPAFQEILAHGRSQNAFAHSDSEFDDYFELRLNQVRNGEPGPIELRWADGKVIRHQITALRGGARMLTYTDITDLARTNAQLEKLASTDGLTGLANRRQFIALAERELARFRRHSHPLSMLLLDIDNFKAINDRFGHDVGDQMIVHVAMLCDENRRETDIVARVGGEEFALLLPDTVMASSCLAGERLRQSISDRPLRTAGIAVPVTVSIGIAEFDPAMSGVSDLMKLADRMLYRAKDAGRNRIVSALDATQRPKLLRSPPIFSDR